MAQNQEVARYQVRRKRGKTKLTSLVNFGGKKASPQKTKAGPSPTPEKPEER
ncbi:hypothetical protein LCGC14_2204860, partial [marine sediment metagenome]